MRALQRRNGLDVDVSLDVSKVFRNNQTAVTVA
jgi:hypothetical protein